MRQGTWPHGLDRAPRRSARSPSPRPASVNRDAPPEPGTTRVLPVQLQIGDRMTDSTGEWEVAGRPFTTEGGKNAQVRLQRVDKPGVTEIRTWGAHEKVSVRREAGKR
jgi:hypothetical protein